MAMAGLILAGCKKQDTGRKGKWWWWWRRHRSRCRRCPLLSGRNRTYHRRPGGAVFFQVPRQAAAPNALPRRRRRSSGRTAVEMDPRPFQAQLDAAEALLLEARARLTLAGQELDRAGTCKKPPAPSPKRNCRAARAPSMSATGRTCKLALANAETARLNMEYCQVLSPITAAPASGLVDPGNVVKANDTAIRGDSRISIQSGLTSP